MKILIFNSLYYPYILGGAEKSVQLLAETLNNNYKDIEVVVVTTSNKNDIKFINGIKVYYLKTSNLYWLYEHNKQNKLLKPFWHLIDSYNISIEENIDDIFFLEKPDLVHTNNLAGFSVYLWKYLKKRYNIPIIHTLRDYYLLCPKTTMFNNKTLKNCNKQCTSCKLYSITRKITSKYVDTVVGISKFILDKHLKHNYFKNSNKTVIYNPVNFKDININKKNKKENIVNLGYVGSISKNKGIELLLEYFSNLKDNNNFILNIFGKGDNNYEKFLQEKYSKYNNIVFHGFKEHNKIYNQIDILIVPSLWNEPFGRIIIEANSYGIPVLASKRGGIIELIKENENGVLFEPLEFKNFEENLRKIIDIFVIKKNPVMFNKKEFDTNYITSLYLNEYNKLLEKKVYKRNAF